MKRCIKCGEVKSIEKFVKNKMCKEGRTNFCKECRNKYQSTVRKKYKIQASIKMLNWARNHPEERRRSDRKYNQKQRDTLGNTYMKRLLLRIFPGRMITAEMIEFQRSLILKYRILREIKGGTYGFTGTGDQRIKNAA